MSSREIADLVEARHNDVIATIERLFAKNLLRSSRKSRRESTGGRPVDVYDLTERDTHLVVAGYSDEHRARVIDRWQELEEMIAKPAFDISSLNDPKVLLALLTDNVRKVVTLEADNTELTKENHLLEVKVEQDAPKVAFHDMVVVSHKTYNAAQAAKIIGTGRTRLLQFMRQKGWITRSNEPYQAKIEAGLLDVKLGTFEHPIDGTIPTCSTLITGKGLAKLEALWRERDADLLA
ncbi:phage antirepressor KilAC domain-containing protein [Pseudomonas sp. FP2294]|uniref:phage antirepressor KilAC domain-containing protein n=1 Tax=Pseudomonas sp. FP2294 TaxID=2954089 RepID=UPI002732D0E4|nr:phage antirepressor KilAC domain-containing protein [Pseudomonas sp. FP2294]WLH60031.1 phage antirepressor KilAC domain-containing protein [Pseudomonas sp. FP2294]